MKFETKAIHVGEEPNLKEGGTGDAVIPIHLASTFARKQVDIPTQGYEYSRTSNPTRNALEARLASLENAQFGLAFASGLAAETTLLLALLDANEHVVAFDDLYGGTKRLFNQVFSARYNIQFSYVDARNIDEVKNSLHTNTKLIWLETPTNPLLKICDIQMITKEIKKLKEDIYIVVDNTFMSPYFQQPLNLGADIIVHSTTKYLNGHSDSVGGAIMLNNKTLYEKIKFTQNAAGAILSPFDSYLVLRGIKTLSVRMKQHQENALKISHFLENHPKVDKVIYPGLPSHPQYRLAQQQMNGFGGMISVELKTNIEGTKQFVENLKYFLIAESLGGVESLIEIPSIMTHAALPKLEREKIGLKDNLIRLSVGIEHVDDLIQDLDQALAKLPR
jgi:cystathionine gamma-lyase